MTVKYNPLDDSIVIQGMTHDEYMETNDYLMTMLNNKINRDPRGFFQGGQTEHIKIDQKIPFSEGLHKYNFPPARHWRCPHIRKIIANDGAVVVTFEDNTKVVVKRMPGDDDDIYAAVAQAVCKRMCGGTSSFHKMVDRKLEDFRSPVSVAQPVFDSFSRFFDSLWDITHPKEDKQDNKEEE